MNKKYRIIIDIVGKPPIVEAENLQEAEEKFTANVIAEELLQLLKFGAEEILEQPEIA